MVNLWVRVAAFVVLACASGLAQSGAAGLDIRGGWQAELYTLKTGERHVVKGLIVFTATEIQGVRAVRLRVDGQDQRWPKGDGETREGALTVYDFPGLVQSAQPPYPAVPSPR